MTCAAGGLVYTGSPDGALLVAGPCTVVQGGSLSGSWVATVSAAASVIASLFAFGVL